MCCATLKGLAAIQRTCLHGNVSARWSAHPAMLNRASRASDARAAVNQTIRADVFSGSAFRCSNGIDAMLKAVKLEAVFEMGVGTDRHRLMVEWHETVGIGYPKDDLATCYPSEKDFISGKELWPELYALNGQRVCLRLRPDGFRRKKVIGVEPQEPGWIPICEAVG